MPVTIKLKKDSIFRQSLLSKKRLNIWITGRGTGKSFVCPAFATYELTTQDYIRGLIVRNEYEAVKNSIYQSFKDRVEQFNVQGLQAIDTGRIIKFNSNYYNGFGFRSSSSQNNAKAKSLTDYNRVIIEEAEEISQKDFRQLNDSIRTKKGNIKIYLLTNPPSKSHWIVKTYLDLTSHPDYEGFYIPTLKPVWNDTVELVTGDYRTNLANLAPEAVSQYESYKDENHPNYDLSYYCVQILGLIPEIKSGLIYTKHIKLSSFDTTKLSNLCYGLDFGYSHPLALVLTGTIDNQEKAIYSHTLLFKSGLTESTIIQELDSLKIDKSIEILADSSRPELIESIAKAGYWITGVDKNYMSVAGQINKLQERRLYHYDTTKYVYGDEQYKTNTEYELNNYVWEKSKKNSGDDPKKENDDIMDAIRYSRMHDMKPKSINYSYYDVYM